MYVMLSLLRPKTKSDKNLHHGILHYVFARQTALMHAKHDAHIVKHLFPCYWWWVTAEMELFMLIASFWLLKYFLFDL